MYYTDASTQTNPGKGSAVWILIGTGLNPQNPQGSGPEKILSKKNITFKHVTNNQVELIAVIEAIVENTGDVYSDSEYAVLGYDRCVKWSTRSVDGRWQNTAGAVKNQELWEIVLKLRPLFKNKLYHVKGHAGNPWNEAADKYAKDLTGKELDYDVYVRELEVRVTELLVNRLERV